LVGIGEGNTGEETSRAGGKAEEDGGDYAEESGDDAAETRGTAQVKQQIHCTHSYTHTA